MLEQRIKINNDKRKNKIFSAKLRKKIANRKWIKRKNKSSCTVITRDD